MSKWERLIDRGSAHSVLITLFHEKQRGNGYATKEKLQEAMMEETKNKKWPSENALRILICKLRTTLKNVGSKCEIEIVPHVGYKIVEIETNESNSPR